MLFPNDPSARSEISRGDDWLTPRRFAALLALLVLVSWPQVFFGLQTFVHRDFGFFAYPIAHYLRESFWRGEIPLWNPLSDCGTPFLAQWNTQVLYPPALFYLLLPLSWALGVFCLLHLYLGGLGMYFLVRRWTQNSFAAAFAGIVFAFNGLMLNSLMWPATIPGLGWMPWVILLTESAWRDGGKNIFLAALVGALQMLSGAVEVVFFTWILVGVLGLVAMTRDPALKIFLRTTAVVLLICGLSAAQLLPFFDLLHDTRQQENITASLWPMPPTGWLNFFVPLFRCQSFQGVFMQDGQYWTSSYYLGVTTMALAVLAICRVRRIIVWALAALILFNLVLALGNATPIYRWLAQHSGFISTMRFPVKFVILPVFLLPLLAAVGLATIETERAAKKNRSGKLWAGLCIVIVAFISGILWWNARSQLISENFVTINGGLRAVIFIALALGLFFVGNISQLKPRRTMQVFLLLLVWFDLFRQAPQPPTVSRAAYEPNVQRHAGTPTAGVDRALIPPSVRTQVISAFLPDVTADYISRRFALSLNCNLLDAIPKCDGFFPLQLHGAVAVLTRDSPEAMQDFLGASEVLTVQTNNFIWQPRTNFMPLISGGQRPIFASDEAIVAGLQQTNFNTRIEVFLPLAAKDSMVATNGTTVKISSETFSAQKIEAIVAAAAPAILVIAQTHYHPWHAYVDGQPAALLPANYAFQAVPIPAGTHQLRLVYEDRKFYLGATLSLLTLLICVVGFCRRSTSDKNK